MDLPSKQVDKWTIETAQMKHAARKESLNAVAQKYLRNRGAEIGIVGDIRDFLKNVSDNPEAYETLTESERDFNDISSSVGVWALVSACIKPYVSLNEWLTFDDRTVERLTLAVQEINGHWFILPGAEKKTNEAPSISTEGSKI